VEYAGHIVHSGASRECNGDALFLMLRWDWYRLDKKCSRTRYAELVLLHSVGYAGHVVHSGASGECNGNALFSCFGWTGRDSIKNLLGHVTSNLCFCFQWDTRVTYCVPVHPGSVTAMHYFSCSGGTGMDSTKNMRRHMTMNLCFCIQWDPRVM
jgi:hypothetical protein